MVPQAVLGALLGLLWWLLAPKPEARYLGLFWYAESNQGFSAAQDVLFGLVTVVPGIVVGVLLTLWSARPGAGRRLTAWLGGAVAGSLVCWMTGCLLGHGFASYAPGAVAPAPLTLTSYGLLAVWPAAAAFAVTLALMGKGLFSSRW
jgi:hypothetical protein